MLANFFMETLGRESLIAADDTWALLMLMVASVARHLAGAEICVGVKNLRRHHRPADRPGGVQLGDHPHQLCAV